MFDIRVKRGSSSLWSEKNPVLASGEIGYSTDTKYLKIGDGVADYSNLPNHTIPENQKLALSAANNPSKNNRYITEAEFEERSDYLKYLVNKLKEPIGIKIDNSSSSPEVERVDVDGATFHTTPSFFDNHVIWGGRVRCVIDYNNSANIIYGSNARGDGLILDGSAGDVMVRCPNVKYKYEVDGNFQYFWVAPFDSNHSGFSYHPNCFQGPAGEFGTAGSPQPEYYTGAYESSLYSDAGTDKLRSVLLQPPHECSIEDAVTLSVIKGAGWGITNVWAWSLEQLLMYIEYGTRNIQAALAPGYTDAGAFGPPPLPNGSQYLNLLLDKNGTGSGRALNTRTEFCWRGMANPYGNLYKYLLGITVDYDGSYKIIKRDGTGRLLRTLPAGSYEEGEGLDTSGNYYIQKIKEDELGALAFLPTASLSSTTGRYLYYCDRWVPPSGDNAILRAGGGATDLHFAGPAQRRGYASQYTRSGARLEFRKIS